VDSDGNSEAKVALTLWTQKQVGIQWTEFKASKGNYMTLKKLVVS
jgi:hypothetical protein